MSIDKFAITEAKALVKTHTGIVYNWAQHDGNSTVSHGLKEALLTSLARVYEIVENLPEPEGLKTLDEDGEKVALND